MRLPLRATTAPIPVWALALAIAVVTAWGLVHVWVRLQLVAVGYEISRETQRQHDLTELTQRLSLELRTRLDLGTLERTAKEKLGMVPPDPQTLRPITLGGPSRPPSRDEAKR